MKRLWHIQTMGIPQKGHAVWLHLCEILEKRRRRRWHPTPVLLPGKSHGQRSLVGCGPWGLEESDTTEQLPFHFHFHALEKETATHSSVLACLENPRDVRAWWAAVYGVAQSRTRLKWLSSCHDKDVIPEGDLSFYLHNYLSITYHLYKNCQSHTWAYTAYAEIWGSLFAVLRVVPLSWQVLHLSPTYRLHMFQDSS